MKKAIFLFLITSLCACSNFVDKPKDLLPEKKMSEILAEMAINDQVLAIDPNKGNVENGTRYILKKYQVSAKTFNDSYEYYAVTKKLEKIIKNSKKRILDKNSKSKDYIEKKLKEKSDVPAFAR